MSLKRTNVLKLSLWVRHGAGGFDYFRRRVGSGDMAFIVKPTYFSKVSFGWGVEFLKWGGFSEKLGATTLTSKIAHHTPRISKMIFDDNRESAVEQTNVE